MIWALAAPKLSRFSSRSRSKIIVCALNQRRAMARHILASLRCFIHARFRSSSLRFSMLAFLLRAHYLDARLLVFRFAPCQRGVLARIELLHRFAVRQRQLL